MNKKIMKISILTFSFLLAIQIPVSAKVNIKSDIENYRTKTEYSSEVKIKEKKFQQRKKLYENIKKDKEKKAKEEAERKAAEEAAARAQAEKQRIIDLVSSRGGNPNYEGSISYRALCQAKEYLGCPYVWGGAGEYVTNSFLDYLSSVYDSSKYIYARNYVGQGIRCFDCSGLVQFSYRLQGKDISRTTYTQAEEGIHVDKADLQVGDLLFFSNKSTCDHVAIYYGDGLMLQAPHTGDVVKISSVTWSTLYEIRRIV